MLGSYGYEGGLAKARLACPDRNTPGSRRDNLNGSIDMGIETTGPRIDAYAPILIGGGVGGLIVGFVVGRWGA